MPDPRGGLALLDNYSKQNDINIPKITTASKLLRAPFVPTPVAVGPRVARCTWDSREVPGSQPAPLFASLHPAKKSIIGTLGEEIFIGSVIYRTLISPACVKLQSTRTCMAVGSQDASLVGATPAARERASPTRTQRESYL